MNAADRAGRIAHDLYHSPATKFVGGLHRPPAMNFMPCHLEQGAGALRVR